ncbi:MAG: hypothetical protein ACK4PR_07545, partial [Gammaproteobacteria bacterium]
IRQHLVSILQKSASTKVDGHILNLLNKYEYTPNATEKVHDLKKLLTKQYKSYFPASVQEKFNDILSDQSTNGEETKLEEPEEQYNNSTIEDYSTVKMDNPVCYEQQANMTAFTQGKSSANVLSNIINKINSKTTNCISIAMSMMYAYLIEFNNEKAHLALLDKISANLHIFLREDAITPYGRTILHILALCRKQDKKAAMIMHTLFNHFEPMKKIVDHKDNKGNTALHMAEPHVTKILLQFHANPKLLNSEKLEAIDYVGEEAVYHRSILLEKPQNMNIQPEMPNLYNETQDNGTAIMGAVFRLINVNQFAEASEILTHFFNADTYPNKFGILQGYMDQHPNVAKKWGEYCTNIPNYNGKNNLHITSILACADYKSKDEAQKALNCLNNLLAALGTNIANEIIVKQAMPAFLNKSICRDSSSQYSHIMIKPLITYGPQTWQNVDLATSLNNNQYNINNISGLIFIVANSHYKSDDDARKGIDFLDSLLRTLGTKAASSAINCKKDGKSYSAVGHIIDSSSTYSPHMLALLIEHGADMNLAQGENNVTPKQLLDSILYEDIEDLDAFAEMKLGFERAFKGQFALKGFMNPQPSSIYQP